MANVIPALAVLVVAVRLTFAIDTCSPCNGGKKDSSNGFCKNCCNHKVSLQDIETNLNATIWEFDKLSPILREKLNNVKKGVSNQCECCKMKMKNPSFGADSKINRKIRFIHEIYANLSFAHDVLDSIESVSKNKHYAKNAMCLLYQANMRLQCKRIRKNRPWANFDDSGACKQNTSLVCRDESCSQKIPEIKDLCKIQEAKTVAVNTLIFLKTRVMKRNGKLVLKRKCRNKQSRNKRSRKCRNKQRGQNRKSGSKRRKAKNRKRKSRKN